MVDTDLDVCVFLTDGDGKKELVIGYSDRRVRSYRWQESAADTLGSSTSSAGTTGAGNLSGGKFVHVESWRLEGQVGNTGIRISYPSDMTGFLLLRTD